MLSACPLVKGWFQGAIMQSGPLLERNFSQSEAENMGKALLERYGLYSIEDARKVDASILCQYGPDLDRGESPFIHALHRRGYSAEGVRDSHPKRPSS